VNRVVVSSDSAHILAVAASAGAQTLLRPDELATDTATIEAVLAHAVRVEAERPDIVVSLQPTVPIRASGLIDGCIRRLLDTDADSVFTAHPEVNIWWREDRGGWVETADWRTNNPERLQRQQLPAERLYWRQDGSVVVTRTWLLDSGDPWRQYPPRRIGGRVQPYPNEAVPDIDGEEDLMVADVLLRYRLLRGKEVA
jgi:CMP-N-acetylneuraminic acid synthetase